MNTRHICFALMLASAASAEEPKLPLFTDPFVAHSDIVAAIKCHQLGMKYMFRLGKRHVMCLSDNATNNPAVIDVEKFLRRLQS